MDLYSLIPAHDMGADPWLADAEAPDACYYHGGAGGLAAGGLILPPSQTGAPCTIDYAPPGAIAERLRRLVFMTDRISVAATWARHAPGGGGAVYEVKPLGPLGKHPGGPAWHAPRARIVRVVPPEEWGNGDDGARRRPSSRGRQIHALNPALRRWAAHRHG